MTPPTTRTLKLVLGLLLALYFVISAYGSYIERKYIDLAGAVFVVGALLCMVWSTWRSA